MARRRRPAARMPVVRPAVTLRVNITPETKATIQNLATASQDGLETGGILLGRGPSEHGLIDIVEAGDPGPNAARKADSFLRDRAHAQELADAAWTRRRATWVGEWHTHPQTGAQPSPRDLITYAELLSDPALDFAVFVAVIVTPGVDEDWTASALTAWLIERTECPELVVVSLLTSPAARYRAGPDAGSLVTKRLADMV
jgi:integrative and conjugative element protein (TIGR02256 family)